MGISATRRRWLDKVLFGTAVYRGLQYLLVYAIVIVLVFGIAIFGWRDTVRQTNSAYSVALEDMAHEMTASVAQLEHAQKLISEGGSIEDADEITVANLYDRIDALTENLEFAIEEGAGQIEPIISYPTGAVQYVAEGRLPGRANIYETEQLLDCAATLRNGRTQLTDAIKIIETRRGRLPSVAERHATYR